MDSKVNSVNIRVVSDTIMPVDGPRLKLTASWLLNIQRPNKVEGEKKKRKKHDDILEILKYTRFIAITAAKCFGIFQWRRFRGPYRRTLKYNNVMPSARGLRPKPK